MAVSRDNALDFIMLATRNWSHVPKLSEDDIGDVATELLRFVMERSAADAERYRYLCENHVRLWSSKMGGSDSLDIDFTGSGHDIDVAIDVARGKPPTPTKGGGDG